VAVPEQTRRWRSGPSQVGDPSSLVGHLQPTTEPKYLQRDPLQGVPAGTLCYGPALVRRGTRRWGSALVAVLAGTLVGAGGSALGQPQAPQTYRLEVDAVAYYLPGKTVLGLPVRKGVVAVDPKLIPLGTKLHVPGYGPGLAADVGTAIKGRVIDLWFPTTAKARSWGRRTVTITIYR
jgi:3D (Asp-Asp-Asp) domain-containing protein